MVDAEGNVRAAASTKSDKPEEAEEVAVALALKDLGCTTVLSDSRQAVRNFARGRVSRAAEKILRGAPTIVEKKKIKWFPAHAGEVSDVSANHNETAHARARELTGRAGPSGERPWHSTRDRMTGYKEITQAYRLARRTLPPPCKGLSREQAVVYRQLQTRTIMSPSLMHKMFPETHPDDTCRVCRKATATLEHIVWDCLNFPEESTTGRLPPAFEEAKRSDDQDLQIQAVQRVLVALTRQVPERPDDGKRGSGLAATATPAKSEVLV